MSYPTHAPRFRLTLLTFVLFTLAIMATVASAITIIVDGTKEAAWDGQGGQIPGIQLDPNEPAITDGYDISEFRWTNDTTNMYFLMETFANTIWTGTPRPTLVICLDTDNNIATGGSYANCNGMDGIDRSIVIQRLNASGTTLTGEVLDADPNTGNYVNDIVAGARQNTINEFSVALADLGLDNTLACSGDIVAAIYFDNGVVDPDDNTPDSGTFTMSCGAPTAVTFTNSNASTPVANMALPFVAVVLFLLTGLSFAYSRRQTL